MARNYTSTLLSVAHSTIEFIYRHPYFPALSLMGLNQILSDQISLYYFKSQHAHDDSMTTHSVMNGCNEGPANSVMTATE